MQDIAGARRHRAWLDAALAEIDAQPAEAEVETAVAVNDSGRVKGEHRRRGHLWVVRSSLPLVAFAGWAAKAGAHVSTPVAVGLASTAVGTVGAAAIVLHHPAAPHHHRPPTVAEAPPPTAHAWSPRSELVPPIRATRSPEPTESPETSSTATPELTLTPPPVLTETAPPLEPSPTPTGTPPVAEMTPPAAVDTPEPARSPESPPATSPPVAPPVTTEAACVVDLHPVADVGLLCSNG